MKINSPSNHCTTNRYALQFHAMVSRTSIRCCPCKSWPRPTANCRLTIFHGLDHLRYNKMIKKIHNFVVKYTILRPFKYHVAIVFQSARLVLKSLHNMYVMERRRDKNRLRCTAKMEKLQMEQRIRIYLADELFSIRSRLTCK